MSAFLLLAWAASTVAAFIVGSLVTARMDASMWRGHGYCPTCKRLSCALEHAP